MAKVNEEYAKLINYVLDTGVTELPEEVRPTYADGTPATTKAAFSYKLRFNNAEDNLLLTTKRVATKSPINEILWIWQQQSNDVAWLQERNVKIWNEWADNDNTIGTSYGHVLANVKRSVVVDQLLLEMNDNNQFSFSKDHLGLNAGTTIKLNQVDYLIYQLKANPKSRRHRVTLWDVESLDTGTLEPCWHSTDWYVLGDKLHLEVNARAADICNGSPFNFFQYSILHRMIAQVTGYKVGEIVFEMVRPHIYERHIDTVIEQINGEEHEQPIITINPDVTSFYGFTVDDVIVEGYVHNGDFKYEIAI